MEVGRQLAAAPDAQLAPDRAAELKPTDPTAGCASAAAAIKAGDVAAYRKRCEALVERFGKTEDTAVAVALGMTCSLDAGALTDYSALVGRLRDVERRKAKSEPSAAAVLAVVLSRAGQFDEAANRLEGTFDRKGQFGSLERLTWALVALKRKQTKEAIDEFGKCHFWARQFDDPRTLEADPFASQAPSDVRLFHQRIIAEAANQFRPEFERYNKIEHRKEPDKEKVKDFDGDE